MIINSSDLFTTIASWTRRLSLSVLLTGCLCSPGWSQVKTAEIVGSSVNDERVTIRIKVTGTDGKPVMGLQDTDFSLLVDDKPVKFRNKDWKSSEETVPPPAWIVVLLDYSGSMREQDSRGTTKIAGAINAIREFVAALADRGSNTQVAIVPFGDPGPNCNGYSVNNENLDKFFPASDFKLSNYLDFLASETPCASTNLYEPLTKTIRFLDNSDDGRFYVSEDSKQPQSRLAVILLSDGYHNKPNEAQDFKTLTSLLKRNEQIIVHTLGYGFTSEQLGQKYGLNRPAKRADIGKGPRKVPAEAFVDQERLATIANMTGGIGEFSADAQTVADKLKLFLNALLGEYEISYTEPNAERGSKHDVRVVVQSSVGSQVKSEPESYTIGVFGRSLPLHIRLLLLLLVLIAMGGGGVLPFWLWAKSLKREAQEA